MRKLCFRQQCASHVYQGGESGLLPKLSFDRLIPMKRRLVLIWLPAARLLSPRRFMSLVRTMALGPTSWRNKAGNWPVLEHFWNDAKSPGHISKAVGGRNTGWAVSDN